MSDIVERLRAVDHMNVEDCFVQSSLFSHAADEIEHLRTALATKEAETLERASPDEIFAAWAAWHSRHGGKLGPGPAFAEAINAAFVKRAAAIQAMKEAKP